MRLITITVLIITLLAAIPLCSTAQYITTIAGNGSFGNSGDGGPASIAKLKNPRDVAIDDSGNVFIADEGINCIRKIDKNGTISTYAGINSMSGFSGDNNLATNAQMTYSMGIGFDRKKNLYITDYHNQRIRKVDAAGIITTIAGNGVIGYTGDNGPATNASMNYPWDVAADKWGDVYFTDNLNHRIRKIDTSGLISTFAGTGIAGYSGDNGPATNAQIRSPLKIAVDTIGNIYFTGDNVVRKVDTSGIITTVAGININGYSGDSGPATAAMISAEGLDLDDTGNIYIAETNVRCVRKINTSGIITTIAGNPLEAGFGGDGGPAINAVFYFTPGVAVDNLGYIYVCDQGNCRIRKTYQHTISVEDIGNLSTTIIYPTPNNGTFCLSQHSHEAQTIPLTIIDLAGRIVHRQNIATNNTTTISTDLPSGIYNLYTGTTCLGKVVIER